MPTKSPLNKRTWEYITANTLRLDYSHRGGGIEIDASDYLDLPGAKMTAYQNYLGGGMLGSVQSSRNFSQCNEPREAKAQRLAEALKRYFYALSNEAVSEWDEWAASPNYEAQQLRSGSGY